MAVPLRLILGETATSVMYNIEPGGLDIPNSVPMNYNVVSNNNGQESK